MVAMTKYVNFHNDQEQQKVFGPNSIASSSDNNSTLISHLYTPSRNPLPIDRYRNQILDILRTFKRTVIFIGETGCGKSTQIPQLCHEVGLGNDGLIAITQPRRIAARTLAERVSYEMGTNIGQLIGYKFRFDSKMDKNTKIIYQTEGILLREALHDVKLRRYSVVIVDEVHERTVNTDVLLHVLKQAQKERRIAKENPLRLILMSATMDVEELYEYLQKPKLYYVRGRTHIVKMYHGTNTKAIDNDYLFNAISTVLQLHESEPKDHGFLVFLTGQEEIETAIRVIKKHRKTHKKYDDILPLALYAAVPQQQQRIVFEPATEGTRKVVFATNIAETSITIQGIRVIIDSGKVKRRAYTAKNRMDILQVENISKAQAIQRAGRAGREAPGKCYRLYTQEDYETFEPIQKPEFLRSNISSVLLTLISLGMSYLKTLSKLISPPDITQLESSIEELLMLQAIKVDTISEQMCVSITDEGESLLHFPIEPTYAKILLEAVKLDCLEEAITVVAFLSVESVYLHSSQDLHCKLENGKFGQQGSISNSTITSAKFHTNDGDHVRFLRLYNAFTSAKHLKASGSDFKVNREDFYREHGLDEARMEKMCQIRKQIYQLCKERKLHFSACANDYRPLRQAIYRGLFQNMCRWDQGKKKYVLERDTGITLTIHPSSCMVNQKMTAFVYTELIQTNEIYACNICPIDVEWCKENNAKNLIKKNSINARNLDRIRHMELIRCSPCSSVSSSSSSSAKRRISANKKKDVGEEEVEDDIFMKEADPVEENESTREKPKNGKNVKENSSGLMDSQKLEVPKIQEGLGLRKAAARITEKKKAGNANAGKSKRQLVVYDNSSCSGED